jgi:AraC-like DNA-binding protein
VGELYREIFGCPVSYEQPRSRVFVRREVLERPMDHPHTEAHRVCVEQCEVMLARMRGGAGLAASVRRMLLQHPRGMPDMQETSRMIGLSGRTLVRRLAEEKTSFTEVQLEVRMTLAGDYLRTTPLDIASIARLLGYRDESSFSRAFRRRFGVPPRAWRAQDMAAPPAST